MVNFRQKVRTVARPVSPEDLFDNHLPPFGTVSYLWKHQADLLDKYDKEGKDKKDVALELATGSGKTLVGLLIAEYQRRAHDRRVVYLCPTRQLAHQTQAKAVEYGFNAVCLVGKKEEFDPNMLNAYLGGEAVAITTYSAGIFNTKPGIEEPQVIVCDDAHAGEGYVADLWSLSVSSGEKYNDVFQALLEFFTHDLRPEIRSLAGNTASRDVDLIPLPRYYDRLPQLHALLDDLCFKHRGKDIMYRWLMIKDNLSACNVYATPSSFLIRPFYPPTLCHRPFAEAVHRVYMSATLGAAGDLERMFGVKKIHRLTSAKKAEANTGRRLILFPSLMQRDAAKLVYEAALQEGERVLVVASGGQRVTVPLKKGLKARGFRVVEAEQIEETLEPFVGAVGSTALLLSNRYDGIDLPEDTCRRQLLSGVPGALNLQERFLMDRLRAYAVLRNRVLVRLTQAMGRCTRSKTDWALVVCDKDLSNWMATHAKLFSPEVQAEIEFGSDQSEGDNRQGMTATEAQDMLDAFFTQSKDWVEKGDPMIRDRTQQLEKAPLPPRPNDLITAAPHETEYIYALWGGDYGRAYEYATQVIDCLNDGSVKPYRALWEYLAASAAFAAYRESGDERYSESYRHNVKQAATTARGSRWIASLTHAHPDLAPASGAPLGVDTISELLEEWGLRGPSFEEHLKQAEADLSASQANLFHRGLAVLGRMLGFRTKTYGNAQAAPDCVWYSEDAFFYTIEAKSDGKPDVPIKVASVREALSHPDWITHDTELPPAREVEVLMISPRVQVDRTAAGIAKGTRHLSCDGTLQLFREASEALSEVRTLGRACDQDQIRTLIVDKYHAKGLAGDKLKAKIRGIALKDMPST